MHIYKIASLFIFWIFATAVPLSAHGESFTPTDFKSILLPQKKNENGKWIYFYELKPIGEFIEKIKGNVEFYPPRFKSEEEKEFVKSELKNAISALKSIERSIESNPNILCAYSKILAMAHNMDMEESAGPNKTPAAFNIFEKALSIDPNNAGCLYHYGTFLYQVPGYQEKAAMYLEKAIKNGVPQARFWLAVVILTLPDGNSAANLKKVTQLLEIYVKDFPNDTQASTLLDAIKKGQLRREYVKH